MIKFSMVIAGKSFFKVDLDGHLMDLTLVSTDEIVAENTKLKADMAWMITKMKKLETEKAELMRMMRASAEANATMFKESIYNKQRAEGLQQLNQELVAIME